MLHYWKVPSSDIVMLEIFLLQWAQVKFCPSAQYRQNRTITHIKKNCLGTLLQQLLDAKFWLRLKLLKNCSILYFVWQLISPSFGFTSLSEIYSKSKFLRTFYIAGPHVQFHPVLIHFLIPPRVERHLLMATIFNEIIVFGRYCRHYVGSSKFRLSFEENFSYFTEKTFC